MTFKVRVGIDLDGVLADFVGPCWDILEKITGLPVSDTPHTAWEFRDCNSLITREHEIDLWAYINSQKNWWQTLRKLPETSLLPTLVREARCFFLTHRITGRGDPVHVQSAKWLETVFGLDHPTVIETEAQKGGLCNALGLDWHIDDRPEVIMDIIENRIHGALTSPVIVTRPWNVAMERCPAVLRVDSFNAAARRILDHGK